MLNLFLQTKRSITFIKPKNLSFFEISSIAGIFIIIIPTLIIALLAPPNTWDSMTYHMPKVMHWIQNKSLIYYPTPESRQLWSAPFAELIILHFQILSHGDRFANMPQWIAFISSIILNSLIVKELYGSRLQQIICALLTATIPMAILQSSSTQNDLICGFLVLSCIYFIIRQLNDSSRIFHVFIWIAAGLAALTKSSALIFLCPFLGWYTLSIFKKYKLNAIIYLIAGTLLFISINLGLYLRNYTLGKDFIDPGKCDTKEVVNQSHEPQLILSNIIKNTALHLNYSIKPLNMQIENAVQSIHSLIGVKIVDNRNTFADYKFALTSATKHEDTAPNPIHMTLILFGFVCFWSFIKNTSAPKPTFWFYLFSILAAWIMFAYLLKWQPWVSRLQTPWFLFCMPLITLILTSRTHKIIQITLLLFAFIFAMPVTFKNSSKKILGTNKNIFKIARIDQYFSNKPDLAFPYQDMANTINNLKIRNLGLGLSGETWEYPIAILLKNSPRIEHLETIPLSPKIYPLGTFIPDAILTNNTHNGEAQIVKSNITFSKVKYLYPLSLYLPDPDNQLKKQFLINTLKNSIEISSQILNPPPQLQNLTVLYQYLDYQNKQIKSILPSEMNSILPDLGNYYDTLFIEGLKLQIQGLANGDQNTFNLGRNKINQWINLVLQNKAVIFKN
ncbi:MAG: glycosyltransferase family 39 protein [Candidatus Omnitrophica bacterium]|nr:glycosyltransferase family 39 protein [Candidatus Omnitrophota bacterium]